MISTVIDTSDLYPALEEYYKSGQRIEVVYNVPMVITSTGDEYRERFYVGKSTGWRPVYLKIKKTNSTGGEAFGTYERDHLVSITPLPRYR